MLDCASLQNVVNKKCHTFPSVNEKKNDETSNWTVIAAWCIDAFKVTPEMYTEHFAGKYHQLWNCSFPMFFGRKYQCATEKSEHLEKMKKKWKRWILLDIKYTQSFSIFALIVPVFFWRQDRYQLHECIENALGTNLKGKENKKRKIKT